MLSSVQKEVVSLRHALYMLSQQAVGKNKLCLHLNARVYTNSHVHKTHCTIECSCSRKGYLTPKYDYCQNYFEVSEHV
jgi:hypothetical protein